MIKNHRRAWHRGSKVSEFVDLMMEHPGIETQSQLAKPGNATPKVIAGK